MNLLLRQFQLDSVDCKKKVSKCHIHEISSESCEHWVKLYPYLKMNKSVMRDAKLVEEKQEKLEFFQSWVEQKQSEATYFELIEALLRIKCKEDAEFVCNLLKKETVVGPTVQSSPKPIGSNMDIIASIPATKGN